MLEIVKNNLKTTAYITLLLTIIGLLVYAVLNIKIEVTQHQYQYQRQDQSQHQEQYTIIIGNNYRKIKGVVEKVAVIKRQKYGKKCVFGNLFWCKDLTRLVINWDKYTRGPLSPFNVKSFMIDPFTGEATIIYYSWKKP